MLLRGGNRRRHPLRGTESCRYGGEISPAVMTFASNSTACGDIDAVRGETAVSRDAHTSLAYVSAAESTCVRRSDVFVWYRRRVNLRRAKASRSRSRCSIMRTTSPGLSTSSRRWRSTGTLILSNSPMPSSAETFATSISDATTIIDCSWRCRNALYSAMYTWHVCVRAT